MSTILSIESYAPDETPQSKADTPYYYLSLSPQLSPKVTQWLAFGLERPLLCTHKIPFHFQSHLNLPEKRWKMKLIVNTHAKGLSRIYLKCLLNTSKMNGSPSVPEMKTSIWSFLKNGKQLNVTLLLNHPFPELAPPFIDLASPHLRGHSDKAETSCRLAWSCWDLTTTYKEAYFRQCHAIFITQL